jgi:HEAT repeat protein
MQRQKGFKSFYLKAKNMKRFFIIVLLPMFLVMSMVGYGKSQVLDKNSAEEHLSRFETTGEGLEELLMMGKEITPLLLNQLGDKKPEIRRTALDLLGRIDLQDDGILNREETIRAIVTAIDGSEPDDIVIDTALRYLQQIDQRKAPHSMIQALFIQLQKGNAKAAWVLGRLGDPSVIPDLEPYVASSDKAVAELSRQALAKLGVQHYLDEILVEFDAEDVRVRSEAFRKLTYIGDKATVREIALFLWNLDAPVPASPHVRFIPYRFLAAWALGQIVNNPPVKKDLAALYIEQDIKTWQTWWESHQHEYP